MNDSDESNGKSSSGGWIVIAVAVVLGWLIWGGGMDTISNDDNDVRIIVVTPRPTSKPSSNPDDWCGGKPAGRDIPEGYVDCMEAHFRPTEVAKRDEWYRERTEESLIERAIEEGQEAGSVPERWDNPQWEDCEDFAFQREAQAFFEAAGGPEEDPFILDEDQDGRACELLPPSLD